MLSSSSSRVIAEWVGEHLGLPWPCVLPRPVALWPVDSLVSDEQRAHQHLTRFLWALLKPSGFTDLQELRVLRQCCYRSMALKAAGCRQASICSDNVITGARFSRKIRLKMPCFLLADCSVTFPSLPSFVCADKNPAENSSQLITHWFLSFFPSLMGVGKEAGEKRMLDKM